MTVKEKIEHILLMTSFMGADLNRAEEVAKQRTAEFIKFRIVQQQIVPFEEGDLQNSIVIKTTDEGLEISWNTPYARRRYFEEANIKRSRNENAMYRWFDSYLEKGTEDYNAVQNYYLDQVIKNLR